MQYISLALHPSGVSVMIHSWGTLGNKYSAVWLREKLSSDGVRLVLTALGRSEQVAQGQSANIKRRGQVIAWAKIAHKMLLEVPLRR